MLASGASASVLGQMQGPRKATQTAGTVVCSQSSSSGEPCSVVQVRKSGVTGDHWAALRTHESTAELAPAIMSRRVHAQEQSDTLMLTSIQDGRLSLSARASGV